MTIFKHKGFTLIELLIVIAILGILSVIGLNNFMSARIKARDISRKTDLQSVAKSLEAYINDQKQYPASLSWGSALTDPAIPSTIYISKLPDNSDSVYLYETTGSTYTLYTRLDNDQDPSIITTDKTCGPTAATKCNYKITSSNL